MHESSGQAIPEGSLRSEEARGGLQECDAVQVISLEGLKSYGELTRNCSAHGLNFGVKARD